MSVVATNVDSSSTTINILPAPTFPSNGGVVLIESEKIQYSHCSDSVLSGCTRGFLGTTAAAHLAGKAITLSSSPVPVNTVTASESLTDSYADVHSHQSYSADLTLDAGAGSNDGSNPKYLASSMWNLFGDTLTRAANYLAGVIGAYSITGTKSTTYPAGAVLGQITDGVTDADGAFVAYVDGDSAVTKANAAFKAMANNSNSGSGFNFGLDLHCAAHDGFNALAILKADARLSHEVCILQTAGAPSNGSTGATFAEIGSLCIDRTNGKLYINTGTKASPTWTVVGSQS